MSEYYVAITHITVLALVILIIMIAKNKIFDSGTKREFLCCYVLIIIAALSEYFAMRLNGTDPSNRIFHIMFKCLELSVAPAIPAVCAIAVMPVKKKWPVWTLVSVHTFIEILSMKFGFVFFVNENNIYLHGDFYWIYYFSYIISSAFLVYRIVRCCIRFQSRNKASLLLIMLFLFIGLHLRIVNNSISISWATVAIGNILFCIYYVDLIQQVDVLTELLNRRSYENNIKLLKTRAYIICIDADDFKRINDEYGHKKGDECLKTIGRIMKESYGRLGLCYRTGGDEFCVIADKNIDMIEAANEVFRAKMEYAVNENPAMTTVSMGQALYNPGGMDIEHTIQNADRKMYENKREKKVRTDDTL